MKYYTILKTTQKNLRLFIISDKPVKGAVTNDNLPIGNIYIGKKLYKTHRGFIKAAEKLLIHTIIK